MKVFGFIVLFFPLVLTFQDQSHMDERDFLLFKDKIHGLIQQDSFIEAALLMDEGLKKAESKGLQDLKAYIYDKRGTLYFKLDNFNLGERYKKVSIHCSDSFNLKKQSLSTRNNLLHSYVLFDKPELFYSNLTDLWEAVEEKSYLRLYIYESEVMMLFKEGKYGRLLEKGQRALAEVHSGKHDDYFSQSPRYGRLKTRFAVTFKMYIAYALAELGTHPKRQLALLKELYASELEDILWFSVRVFKNKARIRKYLAEYYRNISPNKDSLYYYLEQLELANREVEAYLEEKSTKKATFLTSLIVRDRALQQTEAQLTLDAAMMRDRSLEVLLTIVILMTAAILLYHNVKDMRFRTETVKALARINEELKNSINKKSALEGVLENVQETLTKDMYASFSNRLVGIRSAVEILKEIKEERKEDNPVFNSFFNNLEQVVYQLNEDINDLMWANNGKNVYLSSLVGKLRHFAKEVEGVHHDRTINIWEDYEKDHRLPRFWNRQILLIFKEAINNAIKYSGSDIELKVSVLEDVLAIRCWDRGSGFDMQTIKRRSGVSNMVKRAASINCELHIQSKPGKGTAIIFKGKMELRGAQERLSLGQGKTLKESETSVS